MRTTVGRLVVTALLGVALPAGAATSGELLRCQKALHIRATVFAKLVQSALSSCALRVETCQLAQEIDGEDPTQCLLSASAACASYSGKIPAYKSAAGSKVVVACNVVPVGDLEQYLAGLGFSGVNAGCGATTVSELLACLFDGAQCASERTVFALDPRAGAALATAGVAAAHPCVAP
jgi:hypothetical protein